MRSLSAIALGFVVLILVPARDAHAYLDPGTGSLIVQIIAASVLGALFTVKLWLGQAKRFVRRLFGAQAATPATTAAAGATGDTSGPADRK